MCRIRLFLDVSCCFLVGGGGGGGGGGSVQWGGVGGCYLVLSPHSRQTDGADTDRPVLLPHCDIRTHIKKKIYI